jgi:ArsR family transcriptional regulator, arsenate/arsenite/antimonite-responsive transcriptional repressor
LSLVGSREQTYVSSVAVSISVEVTRTPATEVEHSVALLTAAADPVRWIVLRRLTLGEACVCDLQAEADVAPNLLSYHLKVLREAGLVTSTRRGRWIDYRLTDGAMDRLITALPSGGPEP